MGRALVPEYRVLVVDDGSTDRTAVEARAAGADVVERPTDRGYVAALRRGFREASGEVVVTYDGDGENRPSDVERLVEPVAAGRLDQAVWRCRSVACSMPSSMTPRPISACSFVSTSGGMRRSTLPWRPAVQTSTPCS